MANSTTTTLAYRVEAPASLAVVIDDGSQYVYGAGLETMKQSGSWYYYLADGLGSTVAIVDSSGTVQKSYTYDVYGTPTATGSLSNEFDFAGQQTDATGLQYLRARYMDPETGLFISREPLAVLPGWRGNGHAYGGGNPARRVDPTGLAAVDSDSGCGARTCLDGTHPDFPDGNYPGPPKAPESESEDEPQFSGGLALDGDDDNIITQIGNALGWGRDKVDDIVDEAADCLGAAWDARKALLRVTLQTRAHGLAGPSLGASVVIHNAFVACASNQACEGAVNGILLVSASPTAVISMLSSMGYLGAGAAATILADPLVIGVVSLAIADWALYSYAY